jgi:hypothetical protein
MDRVAFLPRSDYEALLALSEDLLSCGRKTQAILDIVRLSARQLTQADGTTIILREGDAVHYVEEDAIGPYGRASVSLRRRAYQVGRSNTLVPRSSRTSTPTLASRSKRTVLPS